MTYHKHCRAKNSPFYNHPIKCELHNQRTAEGVYRCRACNQTWTIGDHDPLPEELIEEGWGVEAASPTVPIDLRNLALIGYHSPDDSVVYIDVEPYITKREPVQGDTSAQEPERVKALRAAAAAVCTSCASGKKPDLLKNFFVRWWHDTFHPCPASPIHDLIEQEIAAALTETFIPESDNTGPFMALQMLAEEARIIYEILAQDGLPKGKYPTFLATIEKAEKYTIKRWKRDDPGFAERHVAEGMQRVKGEAGGKG